MSRSRARLAADWFAKLRQNAVTQEIEHTDVVAAEATAAAEAIAVETAMQAEVDAIAATAAAYTAADVLAKLKTVDGAGSGLDADKLDGYQSADTSAASTVVRRNSSGDINARLFRSEYDSTNAGCQYFMTQVNTATDNYLRPSTLAQVRAAVGKGYTANSVGSYMLCNSNGGGNMSPGATRAGSGLRPTTCGNASLSSYVPAGSWRLMGYRTGTNTSWSGAYESTLWMRYA